MQLSRSSWLSSKLALGNPLGQVSSMARCLLVLTFAGVYLGSSPIAIAKELEEVQQRGYLVIAVKDNLPPLGFKGASAELEGFEVEVAQRLAQDLLNRPNAALLKPVSNSERLSVVLKDQVDLTIARVTATSSRARVVSFSIPYYLDGTMIVTKDGSVQTLADLRNRTVAVLNGSSTIATMRYRLPQTNLVGVDSYQAGYQLLEAGEAVAFASDGSVLAGWVRQYPQYRLLPDRLSVEPLCIVLPRGVQYDKLRRQINDVIARWHEEGWLQERATHWGLPWGKLEVDTPDSSGESDLKKFVK